MAFSNYDVQPSEAKTDKGQNERRSSECADNDSVKNIIAIFKKLFN